MDKFCGLFVTFFICVAYSQAQTCEIFSNNEICDISILSLVTAIDGVQSEELCQIECQMNQDCKHFSWVRFSPEYAKETFCYLLTECYTLSACKFPCIHAVSGPVTPGYIDTCCPEFKSNVSCSQDGFLQTVHYISSEHDCQVSCKTVSDPNPCKYFTFKANSQDCDLFSTCETLDDCASCTTGPQFSDVETCEEESSSSTVDISTTEESTTPTTPIITTTEESTTPTTPITTTPVIQDTEYAVLIGGYTGNLLSSVEAWFPGEISPCTASPTIPALPQAEYDLSAAVLGNMIIYCGGENNNGAALKSCYTYTVGSSRVSWDPAPSMKHGRYLFTLTNINDVLIAAGGSGIGEDYDGSVLLSSVEAYQQGRWTEKVNWKLTTARWGHCAVKYGGSKLVLTGGSPTSTLVEQLDVNTGEWTQMPSMKQGRYRHSCVSFRDDIIVAGGQYNGGNFDSAERFSSATGNWEVLPRLNTGRYIHSMGVLIGFPYIMGGYDGSYIATTEYFNGTQWVYGKPLQNVRGYHGAVVLTCD